jgi:hypothetical protein
VSAASPLVDRHVRETGENAEENRMSQAIRKLCLSGAVVAGGLFAGCGDVSRAPVQFNTPEECFQFAQQATQKKDYAAAVDCLTEDSQEVMAGVLVTAGTMTKALGGMAAAFGAEGDETQQLKQGIQQIDAVLTRHGVTEETLEGLGDANPLANAFVGSEQTDQENPEKALEGLRAMAKPIQDRRTFVAEMFTALDGIGNDTGENPAEAFAGQLKNLEINGDEATGVILKADGEEDPIGFRKTNQGWRIHLDANTLWAQEVSTTPTF